MSIRNRIIAVLMCFLTVELLLVAIVSQSSGRSLSIFPTRQKVSVKTVAVVGDSLVFLSTGELQTQLTPKYPNPDIVSVIGANTAQMRLAIEKLHTSKHPNAVVVALGSNDARLYENAVSTSQKSAELQNSIAQQEAVLQTLSDTPCVIWVGVQEHTAVLNLKQVGPLLNAGFKANIAKYDNAHFLDWNAQMVHHPEWQDADGLHFSDAGNTAYAVAITQAISQLC